MPNGNVGTFVAAAHPFASFGHFAAEYAGLKLDPQTMRYLFDKMVRDQLFLSEFYQVAVDKSPEHGFPGTTIWHLSIKRIDKEPIMDWRDLQAIKSAICGTEAEAIQLFPAESRKVDSANQYHLWVFMKGAGNMLLPRLPIGWEALRPDLAATVASAVGMIGTAKQRPK